MEQNLLPCRDQNSELHFTWAHNGAVYAKPIEQQVAYNWSGSIIPNTIMSSWTAAAAAAADNSLIYMYAPQRRSLKRFVDSTRNSDQSRLEFAWETWRERTVQAFITTPLSLDQFTAELPFLVVSRHVITWNQPEPIVCGEVLWRVELVFELKLFLLPVQNVFRTFCLKHGKFFFCLRFWFFMLRSLTFTEQEWTRCWNKTLSERFQEALRYDWMQHWLQIVIPRSDHWK